MENARLTGLLSASGADIDSSERAEIKGLLSGSATAEDRLTHLAPGVADQVDRVVREAFVHAFDGAMVLCLAVSITGVLAAFLVAGKAPPTRRRAHPRNPHARDRADVERFAEVPSFCDSSLLQERQLIVDHEAVEVGVELARGYGGPGERG